MIRTVEKMESRERELEGNIRALLESQKLAVLSTQRNGQPYSSLMAYAHTSDLTTICVATGKSTRKHGNILSEPRVSLLIDNRSNSETDFHAAAALTILGIAHIIPEDSRAPYQTLYLDKHPYLETFLTAPSTMFLQIEVSHYLMVNRFQQVMELHLKDGLDLFT